MLTTQWVMLFALGCLLATGAVWWMTGRGSHVGQQRLGLVCVQAMGAIGLSFSSDSLFLSLVLAGVIVSAVFWMIQSADMAERLGKY